VNYIAVQHRNEDGRSLMHHKNDQSSPQTK